MKIKVTEVEVWAANVEDRPGGLTEKLTPLAIAGARLEFIIARRAPEQPGKGVVFVTPLKGVKQVKAATRAGFVQTGSLHSVRIEGTDQPGLAATMAKALADAGINLRGLSATVIGKRFIVYLALDSVDDGEEALRVLKNLS
jgi:hypothetical protein